jgi:poly(A) polymerase/tRNA nucleotidyltransferase (CCA-adding enzyme)
MILERDHYDYDFVIQGVAGETLQSYLETQGKVDLVGKSFGVFVFRPHKSTLTFEIALPRTDTSFNTGGYHDFTIHTDPFMPISQDLKRRDFRMNAIALDIHTGELIDPHDGVRDIEKRCIRAVGSPAQRFQEDYTRIMRGIRFAAQLDFDITPWTLRAMKKHAHGVQTIPAERLHNELNKMLLSKNVEKAFALLEATHILSDLLPEIAENIGVQQGKSHIYTVYEHLLKAAQWASEQEYSLEIIMAALFHDCGKARTRKIINGVDTYYNHEYVGEKMCRETLNRLKYSKEFIKKVSHLVKHHMFYYSMGEVSDAGIRRLIAKVGPEHINDLIRLRMADRKGMGRPKAKPFKLQELERRITILQTDPLSVNMLKISGDEMMQRLNINPSPRLKYLKEALLAEVLEDPKKNTSDYLLSRIEELHKFSDEQLKELAPDLEREEKERKKNLLKGFKGVN